MTGQEVVDAEALGRVADAVVEQDHPPEAGPARVPVDLAQPPPEPVAEVVGAVVVESRPVDGRGEHGLHRELGGHRLAEGQSPLLVLAQDGLGQVVDPDALAHQPRTENPPSTARVCPVT